MLSLHNIDISGESHLGEIAANVNHALDSITFSNCHTLSGTIKGKNGADYLGGLIGCGYTDSGKGIVINNCTNYVQINAGNDSNLSGGIVGKINNSKVSNCINYGSIVGNVYSEDNGSTHMGGICASSVNTEFQGCANYGNVHTFFACGISGGYRNRFIGCINAGKFYHSSDGWGYAIGDKNNNYYEDCYYLNSSVMYHALGGEPIYNYRYGISWQDQNLTASSFAEDDLYSGKIAYLLGEYYGQRIGIDKYPVIINDNNRVHKVKFVGDIELVCYVTHGTPVCIADAESSNMYYRDGELFDISQPIIEDVDLEVVEEIHELRKSQW